jgi:hypothetical protein
VIGIDAYRVFGRILSFKRNYKNDETWSRRYPRIVVYLCTKLPYNYPARDTQDSVEEKCAVLGCDAARSKNSAFLIDYEAEA